MKRLILALLTTALAGAAAGQDEPGPEAQDTAPPVLAEPVEPDETSDVPVVPEAGPDPWPGAFKQRPPPENPKFD